jgi:3-hydroxyacyl-[acyl-carrier-protein] dehydratase
MINLNKTEIESLLPHRDPMLLIDELHDIKKLTSATGIVNVKKDSFFVQGHFPWPASHARCAYC